MALLSAVVFDLDGTLIDSRGDIVAAMNHALMSTGRPPLPAQIIVRSVGDGTRALCARAARLAESSPDTDRLVEAFLSYYSDHPVDFTRWTPGIAELLANLGEMPGLALGVCTNKHRRVTDAVLSASGLSSYFKVVVAGGDLPQHKPDPAVLLHASKLFDVAPEQMVMVGDGPQDIACAKRAGTRSIAVEWGFAQGASLAELEPDAIVKNPRMLNETIHRWRAGENAAH